MYCFSVFFSGVAIAGESKIPILFEYQPATADVASSDSDVLVLDEFRVVGTRIVLSRSLERELDRVLSGRPLSLESRQSMIVPDERLDLPREFYGIEREQFSRSKDRLSLKLQDTFFVNLFGEEVVANFRSGVSFKVRKDVKFVLKPSRRKLVSIRFDW